MRTVAAFSLIVAAIFMAVFGAAAQQREPTFRATTQIVSVPTTVTDAQGRLIPNLDEDQFTVLDNMAPQELVFFRNETQPLTVVVMLDYSASMTGSLELLRAAAEQFLLRMLPQDKGQIGAFSDRIEFSGTFTSDRDDLIAAMQKLPNGNPTRLWDAVDKSIDMLKQATGRKVVLIFTDGDDTDSRISFGTALEHARENDVMVYAIGLQSVYFIGQRLVRSQPDRSLRKIAAETGGGYFELKKTDELSPTFTRVAQELHSLYSLGFTPAVLDNKEHTLEVRMKEPGMIARARATYVASAAHLSKTN